MDLEQQLDDADRKALDDLLSRSPSPDQEREHRTAAEQVIPPRQPRRDRPGVKTVSLGWGD